MDRTGSLAIRRNEEKSRFELTLAGMTAFVEYVELGKRIMFMHTEVPDALAGQGAGSTLAREVLDYARDRGLLVQPYCPFIAAYIREHPEYRKLVAPGFAI